MKNKFLKLVLFISFLLILGGVLASGMLFYISSDLPDVRKLANYNPPIPSQILSSDGHILLSIGKEKREVVEINRIPKLVIQAFIAAEDDNFYTHKGIDFLGILRALIMDIKAGKIVQGGSTITQQVAKSLLLSSEKSVLRKAKDILLAYKIEREFTKDEILYLYLNHVYLGGGYYGVKAAFKGYFDKELSEGTIAECALIAGLLVAPAKYSPYVNPSFAKKRQRYVLGRMFEGKMISQSEYQEALVEKIKLRLKKQEFFKAGYFTDWIRQKVIDYFGNDKFLTEGLKITTTLNWEIQQIAEKEALSGAKEIDKRQGFKGPVKTISSEKNIINFIRDYRKKLFEENSNYFVLMPDGEKEFEIDFNENEFLLISQRLNFNYAKAKEFETIHIIDRIQEFVKVGNSYEAIVTEVNDQQKVVYINIGGLNGIIPVKYFRWAHQRINETPKSYFPYVVKPSLILKKGDVILANVVDQLSTIWPNLDEEYKKHEKDSSLIDNLKKKKIFLCELDQYPEVQVALVGLNPENGKIISMVGGIDFVKSKFNRALQSLRQPGSSFKPHIFASALEHGHNPNDIIMDSPEALNGVEEGIKWKPKNYDGKFFGEMTLRNALEKSRNVPTIKLAEEIGVSSIISFAERIGINANLDRDLGLSLGTFGITLLNLVSTFAIYPNGGKKIVPQSITEIVDRHGQSYPVEDIDEFPKLYKYVEEKNIKKAKSITNTSANLGKQMYLSQLTSKQVYDPRLAYIMTRLLQGVVQSGTGQLAKSLGHYIAGKTGTTNDYVDAWFIGFTPNLVTGVWTGLDNNSTLGFGETGGKAALPIWVNFNKNTFKFYGDKSFSVPPGIVNVLINKDTGRPTTGDDENAFMETFVSGTEPGTEQVQDINFESSNSKILDDDDYFKNQ